MHAAAVPRPTGGDGALRTLLVGVGGRTYAIDVRSVREVVLHRAATRLPGTASWVLGLINLRGTLVPVVDLAERLGVTPLNHPAASIVLVEHAGRAVGLAVAEVRDVVALDAGGVQTDLGDGAHTIVLGVARAGDEIVAVLDARAVIDEILNSTGERQ